MIKLIVSDMDGTLLNDEKQIDKRIYDLLPKMRQEGIRFVVASGRQYPSLARDFQEHLPEITVIAENGALVMQDGKELYFKGMNEKQISRCLDIIDKLPETEALVCAKYCCYTESQEVHDLLASPKFHYDCELVDDLYKMTEGVTKVSLMVYGNSTTQSCYDAMYPQLPEEMTLVISGDACLDTGIKGVTKGSALAALQEMWGISPEETLVFGDQFNDVEMFDQAYYSYAMENAMDGVKERARFVAGNNNNGAVVDTICRLTGLTIEGEL